VPNRCTLISLTPALSPILKGERVREWGDSACEKPLRRAEQGWLVYTLIKNHAGEAIFRTPSLPLLTALQSGV
jgi:hypothetical protein